MFSVRVQVCRNRWRLSALSRDPPLVQRDLLCFVLLVKPVRPLLLFSGTEEAAGVGGAEDQMNADGRQTVLNEEFCTPFWVSETEI